MDEPRINLIIEAMIDKLKTIQPQNQYQQSATVVEYDPRRYRPEDNQIVLIEGGARRVPDDACGHIEWMHEFACFCVVVKSEEDAKPIGRRLNRFRADVEKLLMLNAQWDQLALNTILEDPDYAEDAKGQLGAVAVNFIVHYRTLIDDPYS